MKKLFFLIFIILSFYLNAEKFSDYTEVFEPEYTIIYELNSLFKNVQENDLINKAEDGKYKVIHKVNITYLTIKNTVFDGKIYIYDKNTKKLTAEYNFKNGTEDGKQTEYDDNEKPAIIDYIKKGFIIKREIFVNGELTVTKVFKEKIPVRP